VTCGGCRTQRACARPSGASGIICAGLFQTELDCSRLLAPWIALNRVDFLVWLALLGVPRVVPLALVEVVVAVALLVVAALWEAIILLVLLINPPCHHVTQFHNSSRAVASEVVVCVLREKAILEAADDVLVGEVGDGGSCDTLGVKIVKH
jgi:hypothetical protein